MKFQHVILIFSQKMLNKGAFTNSSMDDIGFEKTYNKIYQLLTINHSQPFNLALSSLKQNYISSFKNENLRV